MARTLSDVLSFVEGMIGRGSSFSTIITRHVSLAALWLERNYDFQYMKTVALFTVDVSAENPEVVALPSDIKSIKAVMRKDTSSGDTVWVPLDRVFPKDVTETTEEASPQGYYLEGSNNLILDAVPSEDTDFKVHYVAFTSWPADENATNYLIDKGMDLLAYQAMVSLGTYMKDPQMVQLYDKLRQEALVSFLAGDDEFKYADHRIMLQPFTGFGGSNG